MIVDQKSLTVFKESLFHSPRQVKSKEGLFSFTLSICQAPSLSLVPWLLVTRIKVKLLWNWTSHMRSNYPEMESIFFFTWILSTLRWFKTVLLNPNHQVLMCPCGKWTHKDAFTLQSYSGNLLPRLNWMCGCEI